MECHVLSCGASGTPCDMSCDVMFCMRAAHILCPVRAWAPPLISPSFACEGAPGWEVASPPVGAFPGRTAADPLPASPASGRGEFSVLPTASKPCPSAFCMLFLLLVLFQTVPFSPPPAWQRRDPDSRVSCAGACARAGARIAAARFARLIARARRRTHLACRLNRGRSAPDRHGREAVRADFAYLTSIISQFLRVQALAIELLPEFLRTGCRSAEAEGSPCASEDSRAVRSNVRAGGNRCAKQQESWSQSVLTGVALRERMVNLRCAHRTPDRAVDRLHRPTCFASERERVEHLFALYEQMRAPLEAGMRGKKERRRRKR